MNELPGPRSTPPDKPGGLRGAVANAINTRLLIAVIFGFAFAFFALMTAPVVVTAVTSGRGLTLYGLEISPDNACDHAHEIIAAAKSNDELALYQTFVDRLYIQKRAAASQNSEAAVIDSTKVEMDTFLKNSFGEIAGLAKLRQSAVTATLDNCIRKASETKTYPQGIIPVIVALMVAILIFTYFAMGLLAGLGWPWEGFIKTRK